MDFRMFNDPGYMKVFADSMFADLRAKNIRKLIIDVRENGGGNSDVGDTLLRYISPCPFAQIGRDLIRVTPTTKRLNRYARGYAEGWHYYEEGEEMIRPLTPAEGHFDGEVILLVSHYTFSAAMSFAWAFKQFGMGTVIGEETGGMSVCFIDVTSCQLPHSKLRFGVSYKRNWLYGADETDIHGVIPDITVPAASALGKAIKR